MKRYPLSVLIYFLLTYQFVLGQDNSNFKIQIQQNRLSVIHNGAERLTAGKIHFEGVDFNIAKVSSKGSTGEVFQFESTFKKKSSVKIESSGNVITFFIDPQKSNSSDGQKYLGLFFDVPQFLRGTALFRYGESKAWTKPVQVKEMKDLDSLHNQFFYWQYKDSLYAVAIPLGGKGYNASIGRRGQQLGAKSVSLANNYSNEQIPMLAIAFGKDIYSLIDELTQQGMEAMGYPENLRKKKQYPEVLEKFGWCTWDAFGHKVNEQKVIEGVESFTKNNFPVPFVLIDDGWLRVGEDMKLKSLVPDSIKFPNGFKALVERLKKDHKVENVGIWHTINAYWKGVDMASGLGKQYKDLLYSYKGKLPWSKDTLKTFYCPTPKCEAGMKFFDDWYKYLSGEGISLIKVDNQLAVTQISNNQWPLWNTGQQLQKNFQVPASKYFGGNVINCMEMTTDDIYHFGKSAVARASDDYMPKEISYNLESGNAAVHITNCLYNSLWLSPIVWPDYDMFESYQLYPEYHAIARAISGGPVYVSDWPGEQNFDVLRPLINKDGRIIRADMPARLTEDCLFQVQDAKPLKAYSISGNAGVLGVWNASNSSFVAGSFRPSDLREIKGERFAVYEYFTGDIKLINRDEKLPLSLTRMDYRLYSIIPVQSGVAPIGLLNKYNSPKTIVSHKITDTKIEVVLTEGGTIGVYLDMSPRQLVVNGKTLETIDYSYQNGLLKIEAPVEKFSGKVELVILR